MFCSNCGTKLMEDAVFCQECGCKIHKEKKFSKVMRQIQEKAEKKFTEEKEKRKQEKEEQKRREKEFYAEKSRREDEIEKERIRCEEAERKLREFERGIRYQDLPLEKGYVAKGISEKKGLFFKRPPLRMDFPPIDIRTEDFTTVFGKLKTKELSGGKQKRLKKELMKSYPDRYFLDDLHEWNSYVSRINIKNKKQSSNNSRGNIGNMLVEAWMFDRIMDSWDDNQDHNCDANCDE